MNAKYYRYLFHRVTDGLCYSGSISNQMTKNREDVCFLYLAGGEHCREKSDSYAAPENAYDFLILGDFSEASLERACRVVRSCSVTEILIPKGKREKSEKVTEMLSQAGAQKIRTVEKEEELHRCRELFRIIPVDHGETHTLMLYHADEEGRPDREECVITVKPCVRGMNCISKADHDTQACEMRCMLYNDFTLCKGHNQRDRKEFLDGHLLFASAKEKEEGSDKSTAVTELLSQYQGRLRVTGFADKNLASSEIEETEGKKTERVSRYLVGPADTLPETIKTISTGDPYRRFFAISEQAGLCMSGYYVTRKIVKLPVTA